MTRAALLPFTGDPFCLTYWLHFYKKIWHNEVNVLWIMMNAEVPTEVVDYCNSLREDSPEVRMFHTDRMIDHGPAIDILLTACHQDLVMLVEEDAIIFKPGIVDQCFKKIEDKEYDLVGSARGSCALEIVEKAKEVFGTDDHGPNFWPNFFFCKRDDLLKTDRHFHAKAWKRGDHIVPLHHTFQDEVGYGDTFVWASLQLRGMGLRVGLVDQYHGSPEDIQHHSQMTGIFDRKCPWFHIGSLSGWKSTLLADDLPPRIGEITEWERRVQFWLTFWQFSQPTLPKSMAEFSKQYKAGIDRIIDRYELKVSRIEERQRIYQQLLIDA